MTNAHDEPTRAPCSACGEVPEPGFGACWRCGADLPGFESKNVEASVEHTPEAKPASDERLPTPWRSDDDPLGTAGRAAYEQGKGVVLARIDYAMFAWLGMLFVPLLGIVLVPIAFLMQLLMTRAARGGRTGPSRLGLVQFFAVVQAGFVSLIAFMFLAHISRTPGPFEQAGERLVALPLLGFAIAVIICEVRIASAASQLQRAVTLADQR